MLKVCDLLDGRLRAIHIALDKKEEEERVERMVFYALDELLQICGNLNTSAESSASSCPLLIEPTMGVHRENDLDQSLKNRRRMNLAEISRDALHLRSLAIDAGKALERMEEYLTLLRDLAVEPQASIPDVVIWMLVADKRVAYVRVPAHDILFSPPPSASSSFSQRPVDGNGRFCGKLQTFVLEYPEKRRGSDDRLEIPGTLRVKLWLGLDEHRSFFEESGGGSGGRGGGGGEGKEGEGSGTEIATYAET